MLRVRRAVPVPCVHGEFGRRTLYVGRRLVADPWSHACSATPRGLEGLLPCSAASAAREYALVPDVGQNNTLTCLLLLRLVLLLPLPLPLMLLLLLLLVSYTSTSASSYT